MAERVREWIRRSPYAQALGVEIVELSDRSVRLELPYRDDNSNPGRALHGGVAASLIVLGGQAASRIALPAETGPWRTAAVQISYLSAAVGQAVQCEATVLRPGKELCFVDVSVTTADPAPVARGLVLVHARRGRKPVERPSRDLDEVGSDPGPMGPFIQRVPFISKLGIRVEHMVGGRSRLVMPWQQTNADESGTLHEGALLALLDTTGAMASWAETGPGRYKASTPAMQARILAAPEPGLVVCRGSVRFRDGEVFYADVEAVEEGSRRVVATGTVVYRIVTDRGAPDRT